MFKTFFLTLCGLLLSIMDRISCCARFTLIATKIRDQSHRLRYYVTRIKNTTTIVDQINPCSLTRFRVDEYFEILITIAISAILCTFSFFMLFCGNNSWDLSMTWKKNGLFSRKKNNISEKFVWTKTFHSSRISKQD